MKKDAVQRFLELKDKMDRLRSQADQAAGEAKQLSARLKKEMGTSDPNEAGELLQGMRQEEKELAKTFAEKVENFEREWEKHVK